MLTSNSASAGTISGGTLPWNRAASNSFTNWSLMRVRSFAFMSSRRRRIRRLMSCDVCLCWLMMPVTLVKSATILCSSTWGISGFMPTWTDTDTTIQIIWWQFLQVHQQNAYLANAGGGAVTTVQHPRSLFKGNSVAKCMLPRSLFKAIKINGTLNADGVWKKLIFSMKISGWLLLDRPFVITIWTVHYSLA